MWSRLIGWLAVPASVALAAFAPGGCAPEEVGAFRDLSAARDANSSGPGDAGAGQPDATALIADAAPALNAGVPHDSAAAPDLANATWRSSLSICWTDPGCGRVMSISHGGDWSLLGDPYDSNAALAAAYAHGADGVKIDVRVTRDDVPVISHSSPIQIFESIDCANKRIEDMTAAEVTSCHRFPSPTETFQRLDDVLAWLRGKMVVELTVKRSVDYARAIDQVLASRAEDFAFLEVTTAELQSQIPQIPGGDRLYYLIEIGGALADVDTLLLTIKNPRAFMYEFDPGVDVSTLAPARLHPAGVRAFIYDSSALLGTQQIKAYFDGGYDVVSSNQGENGVAARRQVHMARGVSPP